MLGKIILGPHLLSHEMSGPGLRPLMGGPVRYITSAASNTYGARHVRGGETEWHIRIQKANSSLVSIHDAAEKFNWSVELVGSMSTSSARGLNF